MRGSRKLIRLMAATALSGYVLAGWAADALAGADKPFEYPKARKCDQVDEYHGVTVPDPYRWLEAPDSDESRAWIDAQNKITGSYLSEIPERETFRKRLTELWNYERYSPPHKKGGRYYFKKNDGLQNHDVLYTTKTLSDEPAVLIDPNKFSADGTVAMYGYDVSENGKYIAYGIVKAGSDWVEWRVRDIETGKDLDDHLEWTKFTSPSWTADSKGFFYGRFPKPKEGAALQEANYFQKLYYHRVGTPQSADTLVYERPDQKEWGFSGYVTDDGRYLIISVSKGTERNNLVLYKDLKDDKSKVVELIDKFEAKYNFVDNDGTVFWFQTDLDAPRGRVIAIDIENPERTRWKQVIKQRIDALRSATTVGGKFIGRYLANAATRIIVYNLDGTEAGEVELPGIGSARGFDGRRDDPETFYSFKSYTQPTAIYRYDVSTGVSSVFREPKIGFNPQQYTTRQMFFRTKDNVEVPIYVNYPKRMMRRAENPTYLYGYGGFDIAIEPFFSVANLVWMERGGVFAVANIRGGGEYGKEWHDAGKKLNKQNCFDDFVTAAEFLIEYHFTRPEKLAIGGGSNGGLLVGACMTQRPDLFGAAVPQVGVLDMLRFERFTIGWAWVSDYGSVDNADEFKAMYAYSPLHNLKPGTSYPSTLIMTSDHDDRVVPAHSFKFAAALQAAHAGDNPTLIRIQTQAGHSAGKPTSMKIDEAADRLAFMWRALGMSKKK